MFFFFHQRLIVSNHYFSQNKFAFVSDNLLVFFIRLYSVVRNGERQIKSEFIRWRSFHFWVIFIVKTYLYDETRRHEVLKRHPFLFYFSGMS